MKTFKEYLVGLNISPNPFKEQTIIHYSLPLEGQIKLAIYTIWGTKVKTIKNGFNNKGEYQLNLSTDNLSTGTYYLTLQTQNNIVSRKLVIVQ